jgi:hypothetical protein
MRNMNSRIRSLKVEKLILTIEGTGTDYNPGIVSVEVAGEEYNRKVRARRSSGGLRGSD